MNSANPLHRIFGLLGILMLSTAAHATEAGTTLPAFSLEDAAGAEHTLDTKIQRIYATGGRKSDKVLDAAFTENAQELLNRQNAIVIAEISSAPGFVKRIIRSSLKDRSYQSWVDTKGKTKRLLPYRDTQVAIIDLQERVITRVQHSADSTEVAALLNEALKPPAPAPAEHEKEHENHGTIE